jgi:rhodanese-related sulfurtransferase
MVSTHIQNRTMPWGNFSNIMNQCGGNTEASFQAWLDDPRIVLWAVNQHQAPGAAHPKLLSLPLGVKNGPKNSNPGAIYQAMLRHANATKRKLLVINNSGWRHRAAINALVAANFDNTYEVHCL